MADISLHEKLIDIQQKLMEAEQWFELGNQYYNMAQTVEKENIDGDYLRELGCRMKLKLKQEDVARYHSNGIKRIEAFANKGACKSCVSNSGKTVAVSEAMTANLLPVRECKNEYGCRCCYVPVIE
jgi:hypothetical protein